MNVITVKVIRVPGAVSEIGLTEGSTVADALQTSGMSPGDGEQITLNGVATSSDAVLSDGARLVISKGAKSAA